MRGAGFVPIESQTTPTPAQLAPTPANEPCCVPAWIDNRGRGNCRTKMGGLQATSMRVVRLKAVRRARWLDPDRLP